jgi:methyl-accepting chemotaxis protein
MAWFTNLQVQWKILGVTLTACAVTLGVGLVGYRGIQQTTSELDSLGSGMVPRVAAAGRMHQAMYEAVADLRGAALASEPKAVLDFVADARTAMGETDAAIAQYHTLQLDADETRVLADYDLAHAAWKSAAQKALVALTAPPPTSVARPAITEIIDTQVTPQTDAIDAILNQLRQTHELRIAEVLGAADSRAQMTGLELLVALGLGLVLAIAAGFFVARNIADRARRVEQAITSLADNDATWVAAALEAMSNQDLTVDVQSLTPALPDYGQDEIGRTAAGTNRLRNQIGATILSYGRARAGLQDVVGQIQVAAAALADTSAKLESVGQLTREAVSQVAQAVDSVASGAQETSRSAQETTTAVSQLSQVIDGIARGASDQARQIQTTNLTATEMATGVDEVAAHANHMATASQQTRTIAEHGGQAVRETTAAMTEIQAVVGQAATKVRELGVLGLKIGAVVETIDDIAEQTNLLALNAAIEAARAGEHGKGFAVVADEVRKLAERSGRETKQIAELIAQVQTGTKEAVAAMDSGAAKVGLGSEKAAQAGQALEEILKAVQDTVRQVGEIASSSQLMSSGARSMTDAMQSISAVVEESSAATDQMAAQASAVNDSIQSIAAVSEQQSAATEQVSASTQLMSNQVEQMSAQAQELAKTAEQLKQLVTRFKLDAGRASGASKATPIHKAVTRRAA